VLGLQSRLSQFCDGYFQQVYLIIQPMLSGGALPQTAVGFSVGMHEQRRDETPPLMMSEGIRSSLQQRKQPGVRELESGENAGDRKDSESRNWRLVH